MAPRSRAGIINTTTLTWNRTHNPRRHPCPHCHATPGNPCTNGPRQLTWYHQPRQHLAATEASTHHEQPEQHDAPDVRVPALPTPPPHAQPHPLPRPHPTPGPTRHDRATEWLRNWLTANNYTAPAHDTLTAARNAGISRTTLHRARTRLGITTHQPTGTPHPGWHWNLTPPDLEPDLPPLAAQSLTEAGQLALTINQRAQAHHARP